MRLPTLRSTQGYITNVDATAKPPLTSLNWMSVLVLLLCSPVGQSADVNPVLLILFGSTAAIVVSRASKRGRVAQIICLGVWLFGCCSARRRDGWLLQQESSFSNAPHLCCEEGWEGDGRLCLWTLVASPTRGFRRSGGRQAFMGRQAGGIRREE